MKAHETAMSLIEVLHADESVNRLFSLDELRSAVHPEHNIGQAVALTESVLDSASRWLARLDLDEKRIVTCSVCEAGKRNQGGEAG